MRARMILSRTSKIWLREDGIVWVEILSSVKQVLQDAKDNLAAAVAVSEGDRRSILIDLRQAEPLDPHIRHFYSGTKLGNLFVRLGILVSASSFGRIMGNIYLGVARPGVPIQLFESEEEAITWLKE